MSRNAKFGPMREYGADELALFARYRGQRASVRPLACQGGEGCWVELGPPGLYNRSSTCNKCRGAPRVLRHRVPVA